MTSANKVLMGSGAGDSAYEIEQSVIFDINSAQYLHRTPSTGGNRQTWTFSTWLKLTPDSLYPWIFGYADPAGPWQQSLISSSASQIQFHDDKGGTGTGIRPNRVQRDPSAWFHLVFNMNTTDTTANSRVRIYINGILETDYAQRNLPAINAVPYINSGGVLHKISGARSASASTTAQYAETFFIDGSDLPATAFGELNSDTGQWVPKEYEGDTASFGTTGFYLKYKAGAIGTDSSGKNNHWTVVNTTNADIVTDTPTNNFCTLNPLSNFAAALTKGNLSINQSGHSDTTATFKIPETGKWYWEITLVGASGQTGIAKTSYQVTAGQWGTGVGSIINLNFSNGYAGYNISGQEVAYAGGYSTGDTVSVAVDSDNGKIYFARNNTWGNSGNPLTGSNPAATFTPSDGWQPLIYGPSTGSTTWCFGQRPFAYTPPSGFKALSTANLPDPAIPLPGAQFNTVLYTGNGAVDHDISGVGFQPDFTWIKGRSHAYSHALNDAVRGAGKFLFSDTTAAEAYNANQYFGPFQSDGFRLNDQEVGTQVNGNNVTYVSWNWKANGAGSTDTSGDIDATVSANQAAGFSVVNYVPNGTASATVPHGLGVAPEMVFYKRYNSSSSWFCWTTVIDGSDDYLSLNTNAAKENVSQAGGTSFTSSFIRATNYANNSEAVAYCFVSKPSFSKIGVYTGNGSATAGPFVNLGFKPAFVMVKRTDATAYWTMFDNARSPFNEVNKEVYANEPQAETTSYKVDFLSNGFKFRNAGNDVNTNSATYFFMAFAESPFKTANAR